jgi:DNA-binding CsgD family transcriptional regulator
MKRLQQPLHIGALASPAPITPVALVDILRRLNACDHPDRLRDTLLECLKPYGFAGFSIAMDRKLKSMSVHVGLMSTWPPGTNEKYVAENLFHTDPVMLRANRSVAPFVWDMSIYDPRRKDHARIIALRTRLGTSGGIVVPLMESMGGRTVWFLSGIGFPRCDETLLALQTILAHVVGRLHALRSPDAWNEPIVVFVKQIPLTAREKQVLGWIAFGKSSRDVAAIMNLSEHTVNEHIATAVTKLKASNRTEAVARALLTGDIER